MKRLALALAVLLAIPGAAQAADLDFSQAQVLSAQGQAADNPDVAMNASGQAVVAYTEVDAAGNRRVRVRFRDPGASFGASAGSFGGGAQPRYASAPGSDAGPPTAAIDANG